MTDNMTENTNLIAGATGDWEIVIGLEVHAQVSSDAKVVFRRGHDIRR